MCYLQGACRDLAGEPVELLGQVRLLQRDAGPAVPDPCPPLPAHSRQLHLLPGAEVPQDVVNHILLQQGIEALGAPQYAVSNSLG